MKNVFPFPQTYLTYRFCDSYIKSSVAIEDGDADLDFCNLPLRVPRHQLLAEQFHTVYFGFDSEVRSSVATECGPDIVAHGPHRYEQLIRRFGFQGFTFLRGGTAA